MIIGLNCRDHGFSQTFGNNYQEQSKAYHKGGQGIYGGDSAAADGAFHIDWQSVKASAGCKKRDDEIVYGKRESQ